MITEERSGKYMKFKVDKSSLTDALQKVTGIIGTRTTIPILSNVFIEAGKEKLILTTTDLEIRIRTEIPAKVSEEGKTTLPAKRFFFIVKEISDSEIEISTLENNHILIKYNRGSFKLYAMPPEDFPVASEITTVRNLTFKQNELLRIINLIVYATSTDDSRKVLHGILFSVKENVFTAVATDGKRLALVEKNLENYNGDEGNSIIPQKSAFELQKLLQKEGEIKISLGENQASFIVGETMMTTKLVEGNYPNYRQVIPTAFSRKIEIPRDVFISSLNIVSLAISETSAFVKLLFSKNKLRLSAFSTEIGESNEELTIDYNGPDIPVSFNPVFLKDPLKALTSDKVNLQMNDGYSPVAISGGEGFLYVIMPIRSK